MTWNNCRRSLEPFHWRRNRHWKKNSTRPHQRGVCRFGRCVARPRARRRIAHVAAEKKERERDEKARTAATPLHNRLALVSAKASCKVTTTTPNPIPFSFILVLLLHRTAPHKYIRQQSKEA